MKKSEIREFLKDYGDPVSELEMPDHMWELLMDDHKCVVWYGIEYIIPENCSWWNTEQDEIYEHLVYNHSL